MTRNPTQNRKKLNQAKTNVVCQDCLRLSVCARLIAAEAAARGWWGPQLGWKKQRQGVSGGLQGICRNLRGSGVLGIQWFTGRWRSGLAGIQRHLMTWVYKGLGGFKRGLRRLQRFYSQRQQRHALAIRVWCFARDLEGQDIFQGVQAFSKEGVKVSKGNP